MSLKILNFAPVAVGLTLSLGLLSPNPAEAVSLNFLSLTVDSRATDAALGPSFVVDQNYLATDTIDIGVAGAIQLAGLNELLKVNAAGISVTNGWLPIGAPAGFVTPYAPSLNGSLVLGILGSPAAAFHQLFPANAQNGLGSSTPSTNLSLHATLGSVFGSGLTKGTVLQFRVADEIAYDNYGVFQVTNLGATTSTAAVPEPTTMAGLALAGAGMIWARRRQAIAVFCRARS